VKIFNLNSDEWDGTRDREGWRARGALVGQRVGGELIGATMSEVEPGDKLWPYHTHYLNEEWVLVLRGEPTLRTPEGEQVWKEGDVACFPRGKCMYCIAFTVGGVQQPPGHPRKKVVHTGVSRSPISINRRAFHMAP
jgi:quercetin dioxygenase-like cupin family protein